MSVTVVDARRCAKCRTPLSRYNSDDRCALCLRRAPRGPVTVERPWVSLGACVVRWRHKRGLTQVELAERAGLSAAQLQAVECNRRGCSLDTVRALAAALAVPVGALLISVDAQDPAILARHERLAAEFVTLVACGEEQEAGVLLDRAGEDAAVDPWLLLDQFTRRAVRELVVSATVAQHGRLAGEFVTLLAAGEQQQAGALLHRAAGERAVDPWLFLDQFTQRAVGQLAPS